MAKFVPVNDADLQFAKSNNLPQIELMRYLSVKKRGLALLRWVTHLRHTNQAFIVIEEEYVVPCRKKPHCAIYFVSYS